MIAVCEVEHSMQVCELIVRFLERLKAEVVFGVPGAHILPVFDALHRAGVRVVLAKHEQGAAFMACGYTRASARVGVCLATAGPGATNLATALAHAHAERLPVLALTGEAPTYMFGRGGLQESSGEGGAVDQVALLRPVTRYARMVERTDYLAAVLDQAAAALLDPLPGPVLIALPFNVQKETVADDLPQRLQWPPTRLAPALDGQLDALARLLLAARQPVIVAGYGCVRAGAQAELRALAHRLAIPVACSLKAKGVMAEDDPLALGSLGVTSSGEAYRFIHDHADLLLVLGARFGERTSYVWDAGLTAGKRIVQVDLDPAHLGRTLRPDLAIQGDIRTVLAGLLERLSAGRGEPAPPAHIGQVRGERSDYAMFRAGFAPVQRFFQRLAERFPAGCQVFDDNILFAQNFYRVNPANLYVPNTGISALGHALPAAIGARLGDPTARATFAIVGDGGFQMCGFELMTAVNHAVPVNAVVINNGTLGLIRKNQHQHYGGRHVACDFVNPDFALLARAFGAGHARAQTEAEVDALFDALDLERGINLIELVLPRELYPNYSSRR
ncbi:MAG: thiamine pyrophosphate-binding protein [Burkholderiales bacterium]|nr:thiamine pyrophosphate-binding protein [Burkholderiales bacterium]